MSPRPRNNKGRFITTLSPTRSVDSLVQQKIRQKAYLERRTKARKNFITSFIEVFVIKEQGDEHWLPGSMEHSLLFDLINKLIKGFYVCSNKAMLKYVKRIYFKGDPREAKRPLPRITVHDADDTEKTERVAAFKKWRFPSPIDAVEMDNVNKWLKENTALLRFGFTEATVICFNMFNRYKKCQTSDKFLYSGYPFRSTICASAVTPLSSQDKSGTDRAEDAATIDTTTVAVEEPVVQGSQEERFFRDEMMLLACNDNMYRALKLTIEPTSGIQFGLLCKLWMSTCSDDKPLESWCDFQKDIFTFCRLNAIGKIDSPEYGKLKGDLSDALSAFKMIRESANLSLFEEDISGL